jgi:hypothetical protein
MLAQPSHIRPRLLQHPKPRPTPRPHQHNLLVLPHILNLTVRLQRITIRLTLIQQVSNPFVDAEVLGFELHVGVQVHEGFVGVADEEEAFGALDVGGGVVFVEAGAD